MSTDSIRRVSRRYVDMGKVLLTSSRGAREYSPLDRSDDAIAQEFYDYYLQSVATFGKDKQSSFLLKPPGIGNVSFGLLRKGDKYFFLQLQQRRENEAVAQDVKPDSKRSFNQARFTYISPIEVKSSLQLGLGPFYCLVYENALYPNESKLDNYIEPQRGNLKTWIVEEKPISTETISSIVRGIVNALVSNYQVLAIPNGNGINRTIAPLAVILPGKSNKEKLRIIDEVQYWVYPLLGVITFALDFVTEQQVTLRLYDLYSIAAIPKNTRIFNESDLPVSHEYLEAIQSLSKSDLFHSTLAFYLSKNIHPETAVKLFRLVETDYPFSDEEEITILEKGLDVIKNEHWSIIILQRFGRKDKFKRLLKILPVEQRMGILQKISNSEDISLAEYAAYHLAAINDIDRAPGAVWRARELLLVVIQKNSPSVLDQIPENIKPAIYSEMLFADYRYRANSSADNNAGLMFLVKDKNESKNHGLLQELACRHEDAFFECLRNLPEPSISDFLITKILEELKLIENTWGIKEVIKLWDATQVKHPKLFLQLFDFLLENKTGMNDLSKYPSELISFLKLAPEFLTQLQKPRIDNDLTGNTRPYIKKTTIRTLLSLGKNETAGHLREVCVNASCANIEFASWWLLEELAYSGSNIVISDYPRLALAYYGRSQKDFSGIPDNAQFLLSGGKRGGERSLVESCITSPDNQTKVFLEKYFLYPILTIWIDQKFVIPPLDIAYMVKKLPEENYIKLLAEIVMADTADQNSAIQKLDVDTALYWLKNTQTLRLVYTRENRDHLFELLSTLHKPTIEFVKYLLVEDPGAYPNGRSWRNFAEDIKARYVKYWKSNIRDQFIEDYVELASGVLDNEDYDAKYRLDLLEIANIKDSELFNIKEPVLRNLLLIKFEDHKKTRKLRKKIDDLIIGYLTYRALEIRLQTLTNSTLRLLEDWCVNRKENLTDINILQTVKKVIDERENVIKKPEVGGVPFGKIEPIAKTLIQPKFYVWEIIVGVLLAFLVGLIVIEVLIMSNQAIYNALWDFSRGQ